MRHIFTFAVLLILPLTLAADEGPGEPKSLPARQALQKHEQAMRKADQEWQRAALEAQRTLIAELEAAKSAAMEAKQLQEANAIQAEVDEAKRELDALLGKGGRRFSVDAAKGWQPTMEVKTGETYRITAKGRWSTGGPRLSADGGAKTSKGQEVGYLEARVAGGTPFRSGASKTFTADADGMLELRMFDVMHSDNSGTLSVEVVRLIAAHPEPDEQD